jgi:arabinose-5-phosphate isomerase
MGDTATNTPNTGPGPSPADAGADRSAEEIAYAARVMHDEADAIRLAADALGDDFAHAVDLVQASVDGGGTVLVSGLGKSGLIGQKIAATMSSLGIPAHAVHPTEAVHGDLGRFRRRDVAICISHSGETEEVVALAAILKQDGIPIIAITKGRTGEDTEIPPSGLERLAHATLAELVADEAGKGLQDFVAPTSSTTVTLALGDALALAVARRRAFTDADFRRRHPGGQLGGLLRPVTELLRFRAGENLPLIAPTETITEALERAATIERRPGAMLIVEAGTGALAGIFTDSDLRRLVRRDRAALDRPIAEAMTASPRSLRDTAIARDAVAMVREHRQDEIPVIDAQGRPVGLLDVQDLIAMKLVKD